MFVNISKRIIRRTGNLKNKNNNDNDNDNYYYGLSVFIIGYFIGSLARE
jgi:hypothetical protein